MSFAARCHYHASLTGHSVLVEDVAIPVETAAGDIAQVDFGYVGQLYDAAVGRLRKAWVFVLVLAYSRWMFARIVFDQKAETWLRLHVETFGALVRGGDPDRTDVVVTLARTLHREHCREVVGVRCLASSLGQRPEPARGGPAIAGRLRHLIWRHRPK